MVFPIPPFSAIGSASRMSESLNSLRMGIENLAGNFVRELLKFRGVWWVQISSTRRSRPLAASGLPTTVARTPFLFMCGMSETMTSCPTVSATPSSYLRKPIAPALSGTRAGLGSHAILRTFVAVFRAARGFFRAVAAVVFALAADPTGDGNSSLGCLAVRWWPWRSGWMRAASSAIRSSASTRFRRSSSRYVGIVLVVIEPVWQKYLRPSCPILATRTMYGPPRGVRLMSSEYGK